MVQHGQRFWDLMLQSLNDIHFWRGNSKKPSQAWLESFTPGRPRIFYQGCRESSALKVTRPGRAPDARVISDVSCMRSDVQCQTSRLMCVLWYLMSHVWCLLFDVRRLMSYVKRLMSHVWNLMSHVFRQMPDGCCLISHVWCLLTDVRCLIRRLISDIWLFVV